jgi:hypothetical protein
MTTLLPSRHALVLGLTLLLANGSVNAAAQTAGNSGAAVVGAALGMAAGATFGTVGSIFPCTRTYAGSKCVRTSAIVGTVLGAGSGLALGSVDSEAIERMATGGAIGFTIGAGLGLVVKEVILYSTWGDVLGAGAIGMAVGTSPKGALIGMTVGGALGVTLWQVIPKFDLVNATEVTLLGMAVGGVVSMVYRGISAQAEDDQPTVFFPIRMSF